MGVSQAERCKGLRRFNEWFQGTIEHLRKQIKYLRDPETPRQARLVAGLQVGLTSAGCVLLGTFAFFVFYYKWYETEPSPPKVPTNPRPTIVWGTSPYYLEDKPYECLHEGKVLECDVLDLDSKPPGGADAYIFYGTSMKNLPVPRNPGTLWALLHEESPRNSVFLMHEKALQLFNFTATISRYSDVPYPLLCLEDFNTLTEIKYYKNVSTKNAALDKVAPVLYIQSDCETSTERDKYVLELMKYIQVDSYGLCIRNRQLPLSEPFQPMENREYLKHLNHPMILETVSMYKFWIAIENGVCEDYITEKLWRAIRVGVIPIYLGAPNVRDYLPHPKAAILLEDYPTPALMAARLHELNENDKLYEEHLRHKFTRRIDNQRLIDENDLRNYQYHFDKIVHRLICMTCVRLHENSTRVNMATKKHYNCPEPISAMTLDKNPDNIWITEGRKSEEIVEMIYEKIFTARANNISESFINNLVQIT